MHHIFSEFCSSHILQRRIQQTHFSQSVKDLKLVHMSRWSVNQEQNETKIELCNNPKEIWKMWKTKSHRTSSIIL